MTIPNFCLIQFSAKPLNFASKSKLYGIADEQKSGEFLLLFKTNPFWAKPICFTTTGMSTTWLAQIMHKTI